MADIEAAKAASIDMVLVTYGQGNDEAYSDSYPIKIIDNVNEIIVRDMAQLEDIAKKSRTVEKEQQQFLSKLKKKAKFVNKEKSSGFLSKIWERGN